MNLVRCVYKFDRDQVGREGTQPGLLGRQRYAIQANGNRNHYNDGHNCQPELQEQQH